MKEEYKLIITTCKDKPEDGLLRFSKELFGFVRLTGAFKYLKWLMANKDYSDHYYAVANIQTVTLDDNNSVISEKYEFDYVKLVESPEYK